MTVGSLVFALALLGQPPGGYGGPGYPPGGDPPGEGGGDPPGEGGGEGGGGSYPGGDPPAPKFRIEIVPDEFPVGNQAMVQVTYLDGNNRGDVESTRVACGKETTTRGIPQIYEGKTGNVTVKVKVFSPRRTNHSEAEDSYTALPPDGDQCLTDLYKSVPGTAPGGVSAVMFAYTAKGDPLGPGFRSPVQERFYSNPSGSDPPQWEEDWGTLKGWVPKNYRGRPYPTLRWESYFLDAKDQVRSGVFDVKWYPDSRDAQPNGLRDQYMQQVRIWSVDQCGRKTVHPSKWYHLTFDIIPLNGGDDTRVDIDVAGEHPPDTFGP